MHYKVVTGDWLPPVSGIICLFVHIHIFLFEPQMIVLGLLESIIYRHSVVTKLKDDMKEFHR